MSGVKIWDHKELNKIAALVKDANAWNAFIWLLDHERDLCSRQLNTPMEVDNLLRLNGVMQFIEQLRKTRDIALRVEKVLREEDNGNRQ